MSEIEQQHDVFIARQPILDKHLELFGYELFSRSSQSAEKSDIEHSESSDAEMLFHLLSNFDLESLLGGKLAFLNCTLESLTIEHFELVAPKGVVLEVKRPSKMDSATFMEVTGKLQILKSRGYQIASDDFIFDSEYEPWQTFVDIVKIQANRSVDHNRAIINKAHLINKNVVAELVETQEQYKLLDQLKVDFFQGYFFCKPITMGTSITSPAVTNLIRLMNLTIQEAELDEIEEVLKTDPSLSFKLLRYINSSGFGLRNTIESFKHAVMLLGYKKLFKWLTLLFSTTNKNPGSQAVAKLAVTRARFMELLATDLYGKAEADNCFVIGIFSLLDVMLSVPLDVALKSISLPKSVTETLLEQQGQYAKLYQLTLALEQNDWIEILATAHELKLNSQFITGQHLSALEWSNQLEL